MTPQGARPKVLVIDDDPLHRSLVRAVLEDDHYEVFEAEDASEGLKAAAQNLPQLILVDMWMPRMTGLEFIQAARVQADIKHIPIVVSTALASTSQADDCLQAGAAQYLPKPLDIEPFRAAIKSLVGTPAAE